MRELSKTGRGIKVFQNACPLLVPVVEAGEQNSRAADIILKNYLRPLQERHVDTLVLGCTHYEIFRNRIKKIMGSGVAVVSEERVVPKKLKQYLARHPEIEIKLRRSGTVRFYSTDVTEKFTSLGSKFFGKRIKVKKIVLS